MGRPLVESLRVCMHGQDGKSEPWPARREGEKGGLISIVGNAGEGGRMKKGERFGWVGGNDRGRCVGCVLVPGDRAEIPVERGDKGIA